MKFQAEEWSPGVARPTRLTYTNDIVGKGILAYPADMVRVERASDPKTFVLTLTRSDGFEVSFSLTGEQLSTLGEANTIWTDVDFVHDNRR
jgi:hypothetical protein